MPRTATIRSLPQAFEMIKEMEAQGHKLGEDYREAGRRALAGVLEAGMRHHIDWHLEALARRGEADRRNDSYRRWLLTERGWIELSVPRTRRFSAGAALRAYARCESAAKIDPSPIRGKSLIPFIEMPLVGGHDRRRLNPRPRSNELWPKVGDGLRRRRFAFA